jgi:diguanylate cyclase (GGDEF)-like protein
MALPVHPRITDAAVAVAAGGLMVATGLSSGVWQGVAGACIALGWAGVCAGTLRTAAVGVVLPALALLPGQGWPALPGWTAAGMLLAMGLTKVAETRQRAQLQHLSDELHAAAAEGAVLQHSITRYPALLDACLALSDAREPDQLARTLCERARTLVPEARAIRVWLGAADRPVLMSSVGPDGNTRPAVLGPEVTYVAAEARSLCMREADGWRVMVPLRSGRRQDDADLRGVLEVEVGQGGGARLAVDLLFALGRLGGMGLAAVDLVNQARSLALRDDLTGLFGQHEFLRRLDEQFSHARRHRLPLALVMCDMDHLKRYNDQYGHAAGDLALKSVAAAITEVLPAGGIACRYGGEEFALAVFGLDQQELGRFGERLRGAIAAAIPDPLHRVRTVTASIGAALVGGNDAPREVLARADAAMYRAKAAGRNRVELAPAPAPLPPSPRHTPITAMAAVSSSAAIPLQTPTPTPEEPQTARAAIGEIAAVPAKAFPADGTGALERKTGEGRRATDHGHVGEPRPIMPPAAEPATATWAEAKARDTATPLPKDRP